MKEDSDLRINLNQKRQLENVQFAISDITIKKTRNGDNYLKLRLADKTGAINANYWTKENTDEIKSTLTKGKVVSVTGEVQEWPPDSGNFSISCDPLKSQTIETCNDYDLSDFKAVSEQNRDELLNEIKTKIKSMSNTHLKGLLKSFFDNEDFTTTFKDATAAESKHHNYIGGLIEHTSNVVKACELFCSIYDKLDKDLLLTGAILHDIGKIESYDHSGVSIIRTEGGKLIDHLVLGNSTIKERIDTLDGFPEELKLKVLHLILSHHGEVDKGYGSPVNPQMPEAHLLHLIDNCDSKVHQELKNKVE